MTWISPLLRISNACNQCVNQVLCSSAGKTVEEFTSQIFQMVVFVGQFLSPLQLFLLLNGTVACQVPLSIGILWQEYLSGLLFSIPRGLPNPGIKPTSPALAGGFFTPEPPGKPFQIVSRIYFLAGLGLRTPASCWLSAGDCSQLQWQPSDVSHTCLST